MKNLEAEFKSIAASGWRPELIPEEQILQSQFPEVLDQIAQDQARISELEAMFAEANDENAELDGESGVLPSDQVKALKDHKKSYDLKWKDRLKLLKTAINDLFTLLKQDELIPKGRKKGEFTAGLTHKEAAFEVANLILELASENPAYSDPVALIKSCQTKGSQAKQQSDLIVEKLKAHSDLENELKSLKDNIRQVNRQKDDWVAAARSKITEDEAKELILERFKEILTEQYDGYLRHYILPHIVQSAITDNAIKGATLNKDKLKKLIIHRPPLSEQLKIAKILTTVDNLIEKTENLIAKYESIKQGMMQDLFTRGVDANGQLRPPVDVAPELYKESELGWIPKEWKIDTISSLGRWSGGMTPSKSNPLYWTEGQILWISPKDMDCPIIIDSEDKITKLAFETNSLELFKPNESIALVARSGILRHKLPIALSAVPFTVNQDLKVLVPKDNIQIDYVFQMLKWIEPFILRKIVKAGTTVESIDFQAFLSVKICIPTENEQKEIFKRLNSIDSISDKENMLLVKRRELKKALMQDLLTGKVRVKINEAEGNLS